MFHIFPFLQSDMFLGLLNAISSEKNHPTSMLFLVNMHSTSGQYSFSCHMQGYFHFCGIVINMIRYNFFQSLTKICLRGLTAPLNFCEFKVALNLMHH